MKIWRILFEAEKYPDSCMDCEMSIFNGEEMDDWCYPMNRKTEDMRPSWCPLEIARIAEKKEHDHRLIVHELKQEVMDTI